MLIIKVPRPKDLQSVFTKAKSDAEKNNISWSGDINQGSGSGFGFEGDYVVDENFITVRVLKKPFWATNARIEKEVKSYLSQ